MFWVLHKEVFQPSCSTRFALLLLTSVGLPALSTVFHSKNSLHNTSVFSSLLTAYFYRAGHSPVSCIRTKCVTPWDNRNGWLGVKHQITYLLTATAFEPSGAAGSVKETKQKNKKQKKTHENPVTIKFLRVLFCKINRTQLGFSSSSSSSWYQRCFTVVNGDVLLR